MHINLKSLKNEEGFWSTFLLIFLVTIAMMGMGSMVLMRSEGRATGNQVASLKVNYALDGALYFGATRLNIGALNEGRALNIDGVSVSLDTSNVTGSTDIQLDAVATLGDIVKSQSVILTGGGTGELTAVYAAGAVNMIAAQDSNGVTDPNLIHQNTNTMPDIDYAGLMALGNSAGALTYPPQPSGKTWLPNNWPCANGFYQWGNVLPNVTYVPGDLELIHGQTVHGIYIVDGAVTISSNTRIDGILIMTQPNAAPNLTRQSVWGPQITGGVIVNGTVDGNAFLGTIIRHQPVYMRELGNWVTSWNLGGKLTISQWIIH